MKCQKCEEEGERSRVFPRGGSTTNMYCPSYYDEDGVRHRHDLNTVTQVFECTRGHLWKTFSCTPCPEATCNFGKNPPRIEWLEPIKRYKDV